MKSRDWKFTSGSRSVDILLALSQEQLAWIGAIAMAYNECEEWLKTLFVNTLGPPWVGNELVDNLPLEKVATVSYNTIKKLDVTQDVKLMAEYSLIGEGFTMLKKYREAVIHARLLDQASAIGKAPRKGNPDYVILSIDALSGLYHRLAILREELKELTKAVAFSGNKAALDRDHPTGFEKISKQLAESIQAATLQLRQLQLARIIHSGLRDEVMGGDEAVGLA